MKIQIENLKAFMSTRYALSIYQKADAIVEFNKLVAYTEELEQLNLAYVSKGKRIETTVNCITCGDKLKEHEIGYMSGQCDICWNSN